MKTFTEFIGTFLFLFVISLIGPSGSPITPIVIGGALAALIYMGGHWSGAHYNPAVSFGLFLQKRICAGTFMKFALAQIVAGILAFALGWYLTGKTVAIEPGVGYNTTQALITEIVFTMALVLVVLNVAVSEKTSGRGFYGLAIGFIIIAAAGAGGPISGGAFNPAVGIGATVIHVLKGGGSADFVWIPIVGPLLGAGLGGLIWSIQESAREA